MIDEARPKIRQRKYILVDGLCRLALAAVAIAAWLAASIAQGGSFAVAAEVNAIGIPAPVGFADIVERVKPAVVGVQVKIEGVTTSEEPQQEAPPSHRSPLDRFFRHFGIPMPDAPVPKSGFALGSGFFISSDGYVVTNNHVVSNGVSFEVTIDSGKTYQAKVIGTDPQTDLALIKVSAPTDFPYVRLAPDLPRIGDWVLAVGNPFGLGGTVTAGIVSARGRDIGAGPYEDFIQIDAPVNKGNSGGPTFNVRGEVIGINTAIFSPSGGSVGIAFDIPAENVRLIVQQLKDKGHVTRGWIGVQIQPVTPTIAEAVGLKNPTGALVDQVEPASPAARSDIETGDVITSVDGEAVTDSRDLARKTAALVPGSATTVGVFRAGQERTIMVTAGELPARTVEAKVADQGTASEAPSLGVTLAPARAVPAAGDRGVVITEIDPTGRAAESGLQTGDVIIEVDNRAVNSPADVRKIIEEARSQSKRAILLRIKRGEAMTFVGIPVG
jgi:serine protease Do